MQCLIEIDNAGNSRWYAPHIQRELRGRFDYTRDKEPLAAMESIRLGGPVPGQQLLLDTKARKGVILEPLRKEEYAPMLPKLLAAMRVPGPVTGGLKLDPAEQVYELKDDRDVATWCFWVRRAVQSGVAKLVRGELPTEQMCRGARKQFILPEVKNPAEEERELRRQELAVKLAMMDEKQRADYQRLMAELK